MATVTAIIPTFNRAEFILHALDSVMSQTRPVDQILVIDDGSFDATPDILKPYTDRIHYIYQMNSGPAAARNRGMREVTADFIAFLDSDDIWVENKIEIQLDTLRQNPQIDILFSDMSNFTYNTFDTRPEIKNISIRNYCVHNSFKLDRILECLITENTIPTPTVMLRRACIDHIGFFDESLRIAEDFDYWLRAARCCRFGFIDAVLVKRRRHEGNLVNDWVHRTSSHLQVLNKFRENHPDLPKSTRRLLFEKILDTHYDLGSHFLKQGDFLSAYSHFKTGVPGRLSNGKWLLKLLTAYLFQLGATQRSKTHSI